MPEPPAPPGRLFFALWPDAAVRAALDALAGRVTPPRGRRVRRDNLHLTLLYLGTVGPETRDCLLRAAARVQAPPFTLTLDRTGHWPRPRVLWAGAGATPPALEALVDGLRGAARDCGLEPERRPFRAHVTLARKVARAAPPPEEPVSWAVTGFRLVESHTDPDGARYRVIGGWPLATA